MAEFPYRRLEIWKEADELAFAIDALARESRIAKWSYLHDQIVRAAFSVASNIAEGRGRGTRLDFASFLDRSRASLFEVDYWLHVAARRGDITPEQHTYHREWAEHLSARLWKFRTSLRRPSQT